MNAFCRPFRNWMRFIVWYLSIKYLHELSDREIADLLGVTPKVVNVRIFRARKKLQNLLREE